MVLQVSELAGRLGSDDIRIVLHEAFQDERFAGGRVLVIVPDSTRSCPLPLLFRTIVAELRPRVDRLTFLAALGTHPVPPDRELWSWFGLGPEERARDYGDIAIEQHVVGAGHHAHTAAAQFGVETIAIVQNLADHIRSHPKESGARAPWGCAGAKWGNLIAELLCPP